MGKTERSVTHALQKHNRTHKAWVLQLGFLCGFPDGLHDVKLLLSHLTGLRGAACESPGSRWAA